jgi:N-acyl-D-aspartate/D-glutamate deacylase
VLERYVREQQALSLMDALRKMSLMPAQRLGLTSKGRIAVGADADITIFNPQTVMDKATFDDPAQYSEGIPFVIVNGIVAVKNSVIQAVHPGRPVLHIPMKD